MIEGKIANQAPRYTHKSKTRCEHCRKEIDHPEQRVIRLNIKLAYYVCHYINTPHYIYETKSGRAVTYCSKYCRNRHNHRFQKKG
jgi:hypothetical protein